MRILVVADHFPPASGGLAVQAERLCTRLGQAGHDVSAIAVGPDAGVEQRPEFELVRQPVTLGRLPGAYQEGSPMFHPPWPDPEFRHAVKRVVRRFRPDIIHVHGWSVFSVASLSTPRPPIAVTLHDYGLVCPKKSLMRHRNLCTAGRGARCITCDSEAQPTPRRTGLAAALGINVPLLARRVQCWIAVSEYVARRHASLSALIGRIRVLPPLVDLPAEVRGDPATPPYILYVGAGDENPDKGRATLLEAFRLANPPAYRLVLVGGRSPVSSHDVEDRGYLRGRELVDAFRGATIAVVPSRWPDPCPAVAVEALACGRPVIASDAGGLSEIVQDGTSGLLVRPDDPSALAGALARLTSDDRLRETMSRAARPSVERFSTPRVLRAHEDLYAEIVGGHLRHVELQAA